MPRLSASERARLPDSAFAHIDAKGNRRLPIHDEGHVRAALARFNQVVFESEEARDRARDKLLRAAKKHGIVPVGFITGQIQSARGARRVSDLPTGDLTMLMTDIEGSTALLTRLGDAYARVLNEVRRIIRRSVADNGGREVDARADEFFAVFLDPDAAVAAAVGLQGRLASRRWAQGEQVRVRAGLHHGAAEPTSDGYVGLTVNTVARVCSAAHGGQILATEALVSALGSGRDDLALNDLGSHRLSGLDKPHRLFEVGSGVEVEFPPPRSAGIV